MIINAKEVQSLIELTEWIIKTEVDLYHALEEDEAWPVGFDPNNIVIYDNFILGVLEKHKEEGIQTDALHENGVKMMSFYIPRYIITHSSKLTAQEKGFLTKFYLLQEVHSFVSFLDALENEKVLENIATLSQYPALVSKMLENIKST